MFILPGYFLNEPYSPEQPQPLEAHEGPFVEGKPKGAARIGSHKPWLVVDDGHAELLVAELPLSGSEGDDVGGVVVVGSGACLGLNPRQ